MTKLATEKLIDEHYIQDEEPTLQAVNNPSAKGLHKPAEHLYGEMIDPKKEIVTERTERTKTFELDDGRYRTIGSIPKAHYKDNPGDEEELYKEIDLTLQEKETHYHLPQFNNHARAPYDLVIGKHHIGYVLEGKQGSRVTMMLDQIEDTNIDSRFIEQKVIRSVGANVLNWFIPSLDVSLRVVANPEKVEIWKTIENREAPREFTWTIEEKKSDGVFHFQEDRVDGHDNQDRKIELKHETNIVEETEQFTRYEHREKFTGRSAHIDDPETRSRSWQSAEYPVEIDPSTSKDITANIDDVTNNDAGSFFSGLFLQGTGAGSDYYPGARFQSLGIGQGATISSATLEIYVNALTEGGRQATWFVDKVTDAPQWSSNDLPFNISKGSNSVAWNITSTGVTQKGVTSLVQEVISLSGWSSGNNIRFAGVTLTTANEFGRASFSDYSDSSPDVATLSVTWPSPAPDIVRGPGGGAVQADGNFHY